ncbi:MAG: UDP-N-acetylglucosamine 1-carboxyvinyltransferase [Anaerolineae bacterium]|nr:UDP-N-acetylglucosamine 1-carboxyvinyltransferase [Anaerolineae bacterium]
MSKFIIEGGHPLRGSVTPSGNKNAALPILAACLLTDQPVTLHNVPRIGDVETMLQLLADLGVDVGEWQGSTLTLYARRVHKATLDAGLCRQVRASILLAGPLLARCGELQLPLPGGDVIGRRRVDTHLLALQALGAEVAFGRNFEMSAARLRGADVLLDEASVTATENSIMAAVLAEGTTVIRNAASEPHVQDLCHFLNGLGARITGIGSNTLVIEGVSHLSGGEFTLCPDHTEIGSFIGLGAVTAGEIRIRNVQPSQLRMILFVFRDRLGVKMRFEDGDLVIEDGQELCIRPDVGGAVPKIDDAPWPAFPADLMSIALVVATQARGTVLIHEKMFESRLYFVDKLISMGAQIILCDPHRCVVVGPSRLQGQELISPDIRAGMALLIAALCAEGQSTIGNIGQIDRGYERIDEKLRRLGARIERVE